MGQSGYSCLKHVNVAESDSGLIVKHVIVVKLTYVRLLHVTTSINLK